MRPDLTDYVLDASALLCLINAEPGADRVLRVLQGSAISVVNIAEVIAKRLEFGDDYALLTADIARLDMRIVDMNFSQAALCARMRAPTRASGLSLGDRACLALAKANHATALTCDRAWMSFAEPLGIAIELVR